MTKITFIAVLFTASWPLFAETYSVETLIARTERTFGIREAEAIVSGMKSKGFVDSMWMDMRLGYELMDFSDPEMLSHRFSVKQEFPLWGRTGMKREIADRDLSAALIMASDRRLLLRKMLRDNLAEYSFALQAKAIREEELKLLGDFTEIVKTRYATDGSRLPEMTRVEILSARTRNMLLMTGTMMEMAQNMVFDLVDIDAADARIGDFTIIYNEKAILTLDPRVLYSRTLAHAPVLADLENRIRRSEKEILLARIDYLPNLMLETSYATSPSGRPPGYFSVGVEVNLPVFSASGKSAMIRMKEFEKQEQVMRLSGLKNDLARLIQRRTFEAANLVRQIELYETQIIRLQSDTTNSLLAAYGVGKAEFEMVMEALLMIFDSRETYHQYRRKLAGILVELEYLTGESLFTLEA